MSPKAEQVYIFIRAFIQEHQYPPTYRDIANGCLMARSSVPYYLAELQGAGYLERQAGQARSLRLTSKVLDK